MPVPKPIARTVFFLSFLFAAILPGILPAQTGAGNFYIRFPDDVPSVECVPGLAYGAPEVFNPDSLDLSITFQDESFLSWTPDGSFMFERTWTVYNAATYDPGLPLTLVPNPTPVAGFQVPASMTGPVLSPFDAPAPWTPTVSYLIPTDTVPTNYAMFWSPTANGYLYKQLVWVIDTRDPAILNCPSDTLAVSDSTSNDPQLWHAPFWWDPAALSNDLTDAPVDLSITTVDSCADGHLGVEYYLYMDLDGDGAWETVAGNFPSVAPAGTVLYGNLDDPSNGTDVRLFDHRPVQPFQRYRFIAQVTANGLERTFAMAWRSDLPAPAADTIVPVQLPRGRYKIRWIAEDGFWNQDTCEYVFTVGPDLLVKAEAAFRPAGFRLDQNRPNPWDERTVIAFELPAAGPVRLTIRDATGRQVYVHDAVYPPGRHSVPIDAAALAGGAGWHWYTLQTGGQALTRKMLRVE